ncbi:MAG: energy transducer TonB [Nitrospirae bacterium]|nr:energy transducer TonB [Nitrospirota bacterium]MCL5977339.1 energy transducer TonB [Nitrospirota bacterium]
MRRFKDNFSNEKHLSASLWVSFVIHAAIFLVFLQFGKVIVLANKPLVIDFSIGNKISLNSRMHEKATDDKPKPKKQIVRESRSLPAPRTEELPIRTEHKQTMPVEANPDSVPIAAALEPGSRTVLKKDATHTNADAVKTTSGGAKITSAVAEVKAKYLKEHFIYIRDMIMKNISYPRTARKMGWEGKVVVSFIVNGNGFVENIKIVESCGVDMLDKNAVDTVRKASPFPKPPIEAQVIIPIVYRLD